MLKTALVAMALTTAAPVALADGFRCTTENSGLDVKVYNHTNPMKGTRSAAIMVVSDPSVARGRQTIARFRSGETLTNTGADYRGRVDLRRHDRGERIGGTRLGQVRRIHLNVDFEYDEPVSHGTKLGAFLTLFKRGGETVRLEALCTRYLKHPKLGAKG